MPKLEVLDLNDNKIVYFGIWAGHHYSLINTPNIKVLKMSNNLLNQKVFEGFDLRSLEYIELKNTEILMESVLL